MVLEEAPCDPELDWVLEAVTVAEREGVPVCEIVEVLEGVIEPVGAWVLLIAAACELDWVLEVVTVAEREGVPVCEIVEALEGVIEPVCAWVLLIAAA